MTENSKPALYVRNHCGFCYSVMRVVDELSIDLEVRNIWAEQEHQQALVQATGRGTVPVLRYTNESGEDVWMAESRDIIRYLKETHG